MTRFRAMTLALSALTLGLALVACGDDDDGASPEGTAPGGGGRATTAGQPGGGEEDATVRIVIQGNAFNPSEFSVTAGEDVTLAIENADTVDHTFTLYTDVDFTTMQGTTLALGPNDSDRAFGTFGEATYYFRCEIHPTQMRGSFKAK